MAISLQQKYKLIQNIDKIIWYDKNHKNMVDDEKYSNANNEKKKRIYIGVNQLQFFIMVRQFIYSSFMISCRKEDIV